MKSFYKVLKRLAFPYGKFIALSVICNFIGTIFSLFSFAVIIPVLEILFQISDATYEYMPIQTDNLVEILKNDFYYYITQIIQNSGASLALLLLGVVLVIMTLFKTGFSYLGSYFIIPVRTGVLRDIRNQIFKKITTLPIGFFSDEKKGDIITRMTSDANEVENSIMSSLDLLFKNPIMILVYLGMMAWMSWKLTLFVLIVLPVAGGIIGHIGKNLKKKSKLGQQQLGEIISQTEESLSGLRIIKAFNAEDKIYSRFTHLTETFRDTTNKINRRYNLAHPVSEFLGTALIAVVLWFGGSLILGDTSDISAPTFIYYLIIFYSIINPAKEVSKATYSIQKGLASIERIDKILNEENPLTKIENPINKTSFDSKIEYKNVSFTYNQQRTVLYDINLTIEKGKTIALVGQSGSGKSTLVDLLPRYYDVTAGSISIDGVNIKNIPLFNLRELMGNVNQEAILFNDTFYNNIIFGVNPEQITQEDVERAAKIANAHEFIMASENGYQTNIGERGSKLSGGQRQRISIARAILKNPPILILDEATSALDTESERLVQSALENLMKNRTTIVIAHRLSTIKNADEICVVQDGRIVERGKHDELIALNGVYNKLQDLQK